MSGQEGQGGGGELLHQDQVVPGEKETVAGRVEAGPEVAGLVTTSLGLVETHRAQS